MSSVFTPLTEEVYFAEATEDEVNPFRIYLQWLLTTFSLVCLQWLYPDVFVNSVLVSQLFICGGADLGEADYSNQ